MTCCGAVFTRIKRVPLVLAAQDGWVQEYDFITPYVEELEQIIDLEAIQPGRPADWG